mgnify:CR=1 FL=1
MKILFTLYLICCTSAFSQTLNVSGSANVGTLIQQGGAASSANPFTLVQTNGGNYNPGDLTVTLTSPATVGNLFVVFIKWETGGEFTGVTLGSQSFTAGTKTSHGSVGLFGRFFYILSADNTSSTIQTTGTGTRDWVTVTVFEFSATGTHSLAAEGAASSGTSSSVASGSFNPGVDAGLALGGYGEYATLTVSDKQIGTTAATGSVQNLQTHAWYLLFSSALGSVTANCTLSSSSEWVCPSISFKSL